MQALWQAVLSIGAALLALALAVTVLPRLGRPGSRVADWLSNAPGVDAVVALFTWVPWLVGGLVWGWIGVAGALLGQVVALYGWMLLHELVYRRMTRGARLVKVHHKLVGPWRNQLALGLTVVGVPVLWAVRLPGPFQTTIKHGCSRGEHVFCFCPGYGFPTLTKDAVP